MFIDVADDLWSACLAGVGWTFWPNPGRNALTKGFFGSPAKVSQLLYSGLSSVPYSVIIVATSLRDPFDKNHASASPIMRKKGFSPS